MKRLAALLLSLALVVLTACAVVGDSDEAPPAAPIIHVDGPDADHKADDELKLSPSAQAALREAETGTDPELDLGKAGPPLRDETPLGSPLAAPGYDAQVSPNPKARANFRASQRAAERTTEDTLLQDRRLGLPHASLRIQSVPGCRTRFVRNSSSRRGARPAVVFWHYTASTNRPGWSDIDGLTAYANSSAQVSWHFLIDREGHCNYTVPLDLKAWTQANANPFAIGFEIIGRGNEPDYAGAGFAKVAQITKYVAAWYGIPIRQASVSGCRLIRSGVYTHWPLGACGGGHVDIKPYSYTALIRKLDSAAPPLSRLTKGERLIVTRRCYHWTKRHASKPGSSSYNTHLKWSRHWKSEAGKQKALLTRLGHYAIRSRGYRRQTMARAEALEAKHRVELCR